jgi:hypothetical protein
MSNTKLDLVQIYTRGDAEGFTAYQIWRILNAEVVSEGLKNAKGQLAWSRPQMVYNYNRNGMVVQGQKNVDRFTRDQVDAFVQKQLAKLRSNQGKKETEVRITSEMQSAARG